MPGSPQAAPSSGAAVDVRGLTMRYGDTLAVDGLDLAVRRHTVTAVLGPNGAGKTTTLETCEGYRSPQGGEVRVLGLDPVRQRRELLPRIGVMLQEGGAWSGVRAEEMLRHVASLHRDPVPVGDLVDRLGLGSCGRTPYRRLSGGQKARLGLAMAIVGRPELVFVDEPTAGMDPAGRRETWSLLEQLRADGVTVVLTTHYMDEAERLADEVHIIDRGRRIASGTPESLTGGAGGSLRLTSEQAPPEGAEDGLASALGDGVSVTRSAGAGRAGEGRVLVATGPLDASAAGRATAWCAGSGLTVTGVTWSPRSLEDVFLELTGRSLEDGAPVTADAGSRQRGGESPRDGELVR